MVKQNKAVHKNKNKNKFWNWDKQKLKLFKNIKSKFTKKPVLKIYQSKLPIRVKMDASDFALGACLLQKYNKIWHSVAYYSCKITPSKLNYNIYNKELLKIIVVLKE